MSPCKTLCFLLLGLWVVEARGGGPEGLPGKLLAEVQSPSDLPSGHYAAAGVWQAAGQLARIGGQIVTDVDAEGGKAWEVHVPAEAGTRIGGMPASATLFGPYVELPPGKYVAFFRVKLLGDAIDAIAARLDASVSMGSKTLAVCPLSVGDLTANRYVDVPLGFEYSGGRLECRLHWAGLASLRVDRVALYRLTGIGLGTLAGRVAAPRPSGSPRDLAGTAEPRPWPDVFPRSQPPARRLWVVDLRPLPPDWQLCLVTLQGIVNREQPEIYCLLNPTDQEWLQWSVKRGWIEAAQTVSAAELVEHFRGRVKGAIVTDPALPASKHVATMLAGLEDCIAVSPRLAAELHLAIREDLRGRWATSVDAYRWALGLWPRMNHHVAACYWADAVASYDYFVQHKVFVFWISGCLDGARKYARPDAEVQLVEELLAKMPPNSAVMGFPWAGDDIGIGEGPGVTLFAEFAKYLVGAVDCTNLSVRSGLAVGRLRQRPAPPPPRLEQDKVYVAAILSDGDNLPVSAIHNFPQLWKDPARGTFPLGWSLSPSATLLQPDIVDYYYQTASPRDCFVAAVSGVGYTYPDSYALRYAKQRRMPLFDEFLDQTAAGMARSDQQIAWIMGATRPELIRRYAERIGPLTAIFPDYGRTVGGYQDATYPTARNVGVFHAANNWKEGATDEEQVARTVAQLRAFAPRQRPAFLHFFVWNWGYKLPMIREVFRRLGPEYVAVRPDHLAALYGQHLAQEHIFVRLPAQAPAVEGLRLTLSGRVQNTSPGPLDVRLRVQSGMESVSLLPSPRPRPWVHGARGARPLPQAGEGSLPLQLKLAPAEAADLTLSGVPTGKKIVLEGQVPTGPQRWEIDSRMVLRRDVVGQLPTNSVLAIEQVYAAPLLSHRSGRAVPDADAAGGESWLAETGRDPPGYVIFGPYRETSPGQYLAMFRLKRSGDASGDVAVVDVAVGGGRTIAQTVCKSHDLPPGQYRSLALRFTCPGGKLETRVLWHGKAALAVDSITLWREEPPK